MYTSNTVSIELPKAQETNFVEAVGPWNLDELQGFVLFFWAIPKKNNKTICEEIPSGKLT